MDSKSKDSKFKRQVREVFTWKLLGLKSEGDIIEGYYFFTSHPETQMSARYNFERRTSQLKSQEVTWMKVENDDEEIYDNTVGIYDSRRRFVDFFINDVTERPLLRRVLNEAENQIREIYPDIKVNRVRGNG